MEHSFLYWKQSKKMWDRGKFSSYPAFPPPHHFSLVLFFHTQILFRYFGDILRRIWWRSVPGSLLVRIKCLKVLQGFELTILITFYIKWQNLVENYSEYDWTRFGVLSFFVALPAILPVWNLKLQSGTKGDRSCP